MQEQKAVQPAGGKRMKDDNFQKELDKIKKSDIKLKPQKAPKQTKTIKKESKMKSKTPIIVSIVVTAVVTLGVVFAGFKLYEYVYNKGVNDEKARQTSITEEVVKSVKQLKD